MFTSYRLLNEKKINFAFNRGRYHGYRSCDAKFQCARLQICSSTCRLSPPQTPWSPPGYPGYACVVVGRNNSLLYTAPKYSAVVKHVANACRFNVNMQRAFQSQ